MICVVDYGAGNLASVRNVFDQLGQSIDVVTRPEDLGRYSRLILPGVGSFRRAMETLESRGWTAPIRAFADEGKPVLGICLGMQVRSTVRRPGSASFRGASRSWSRHRRTGCRTSAGTI